jgi:CheY-like chemotaxis protein
MLSLSNARRVAPSAPSSSRANISRSGVWGSGVVEALRGRVLVVDDSDVFLAAAASVISDTSTLRLVGAVGSGEEAIRLLPQLRPDLVLLDFQMPGMDGIQTTLIIRPDGPRTVVIVISADLAGRGDVARAAGAATTLDKRDFVPHTLDALWLEHMPDGVYLALSRSSERRMIALGRANRVRALRAKLKRDLREGTVRLEQILATGADYLASAEVFDLLVAVPKIGPVKAAHLLTIARISPSKTVGALSERQQARLIELLSR